MIACNSIARQVLSLYYMQGMDSVFFCQRQAEHATIYKDNFRACVLVDMRAIAMSEDARLDSACGCWVPRGFNVFVHQRRHDALYPICLRLRYIFVTILAYPIAVS